MTITRPIARPILSPLTRAVTAGGGGALPEIARLVTVACGNSISAQSKYDGAGSCWRWDGELMVANTFSGAPLRFKTITASTRSDKHGVYGYSGQRLDTINADISAQWITPINSAGVTPELVVGLALLENDLIQNSNVADMTTRLTAWIAAVQAAWPNAKLLLCTPRPATGYNTPQIVANYQAMRDYVLGLANNRTIFTARLDGYEDSASPGTPLAGYTDGTHPNVKGAMVNARTLAATLRRIGRVVATETITSANLTLTGSTAATGTGVTGTKPTGTGTTGTAGLTTVSTALNPGWQMTVSGSGVVAPWFVNSPANPVAAAPTYISPYMTIRLGAGAENLRTIQLDPRITDGGGNTFRLFLQTRGADADLSFVEGDELTFLVPPHAANSGSITSLMNYITVQMKATAATATFTVLQQGWANVP